MLSFYLAGFKKILNIVKKIFLVVAIYFIVISLFVYFINKDKPKITSNPIQKNREEIYKIINDKNLNSTKEGKLTIALYRAMMCGMIGEACTDNPADGDKNFNHSLFGFISNLIVLPYTNPPASGVYWAYSGLQNAGFIPKTYAAEGIGFAAIRPLMNIWKVFRDISYMLLVLVLIAIGFMIMFRMKLNPQTVISVENALPKIVISLLLITFSFPIAGFLIDLMYIIILLVIAILSNQDNFFNATEVQNQYLNANLNNIGTYILPLGIIGNLWHVSNSLMAILPTYLNQIIRLTVGSIIAIFVFSRLHEPIGNFADTINESVSGNLITEPLGGLAELLIKAFVFSELAFLSFILGYNSVPIIIFILVCVTFAFLLFRIFFMLFTTYIRIFLMIVLSPLLLLLDAIPGKNIFGFWLKNLFVDLLTFPIVITLTVLTYLIINILPSSGNIWTPPFLSSLNPQAFTVLLGMGLFFMTPELVKTIKELLGAKGLPFGFSLGTFFGGVGAAWSGATAGLGMFTSLSQMPFLSSIPGVGKIYKELQAKKIIPKTISQEVAEYLADKELAGRSGGQT